LLDWKFTSGSIMTQHYVSLYIKDLEKVNTLSAVRAQLKIINAPVLSWLVDSNNVYSKSLNAIVADHCLCFNRAAREREKNFSRSASRMQTPAGFFQWFLAKSMVIFKIMCCLLRINKFGANWGQGETKRRYVKHIFTKRNVKFYRLLSLTQGINDPSSFHILMTGIT